MKFLFGNRSKSHFLDASVKEEPDFIETHCHWTGCDKDFESQEHLVKVTSIYLNST